MTASKLFLLFDENEVVEYLDAAIEVARESKARQAEDAEINTMIGRIDWSTVAI